MELILKNVKKEHLPLFTELAKMLKVEIDVNNTDIYDPTFVAKILEAEKDINNGKGVKIDIKDLWK